MTTQQFELNMWADAEITPGPVRLAMEAEQKQQEAEQAKTEETDPEGDAQ